MLLWNFYNCFEKFSISFSIYKLVFEIILIFNKIEIEREKYWTDKVTIQQIELIKQTIY